MRILLLSLPASGFPRDPFLEPQIQVVKSAKKTGAEKAVLLCAASDQKIEPDRKQNSDCKNTSEEKLKLFTLFIEAEEKGYV